MILTPVLLLPGCVTSSDFRIQDLAKSDIDVVADIHLGQATTLLKTLTRKLYHMNPRELAKSKGATIDSRISEIFQCPPKVDGPPEASGPLKADDPPEVGGSPETEGTQKPDGTTTILLGLDPEFKGDRVFTVMSGLYTMLHVAYGNNCELFLTDALDAQALYNSARNIEILVWRLNKRHDYQGALLLQTNQTDGQIRNLSFERLFGKLISLQDTMARIAASKGGRMITEVVHRAAGMAFLPL